MSIKVEANLTVEMARTLIFPAAIRYQNQLAVTYANLKVVGCDGDMSTLETVNQQVKGLQDAVASLDKVLEEEGADDLTAEARHCCDVVLPAMESVRKFADQLEGMVADDLWPLPTYQEMLFIR